MGRYFIGRPLLFCLPLPSALRHSSKSQRDWWVADLSPHCFSTWALPPLFHVEDLSTEHCIVNSVGFGDRKARVRILKPPRLRVISFPILLSKLLNHHEIWRDRKSSYFTGLFWVFTRTVLRNCLRPCFMKDSVYFLRLLMTSSLLFGLWFHRTIGN